MIESDTKKTETETVKLQDLGKRFRSAFGCNSYGDIGFQNLPNVWVVFVMHGGKFKLHSTRSV